LDANSNLALYQSETTTFGLKASLNFWWHCQTKLAWDGQGGLVASPYDKTLPIQVL
jgi:hypothetical protein